MLLLLLLLLLLLILGVLGELLLVLGHLELLVLVLELPAGGRGLRRERLLAEKRERERDRGGKRGKEWERESGKTNGSWEVRE